MKIKKDVLFKKGFTLVELLIVIAITGILAGVVTVNLSGAKEKAKRASALTTASSVLPELVICADDGGVVTNTTPVAGGRICCAAAACGAYYDGHNVAWPDINAKTGWNYGSISGTLMDGDVIFTLTKTDQPAITCNLANNECS